MINIKVDSRKVKEGDTFVALRGLTSDGHEFCQKALDNGATLLVVDHELDIDGEQLVVNDTQVWLKEYLKEHHADKINEMKILGITGTNGKTTTAYLTYQLLNKLGTKTAYIGTIGFYIPGKEPVELNNTTPILLELYELLLEAREAECEAVMMEVSSHALDQDRIYGLDFKVGAFTNLTQDHLDYHKSMNDYLKAKLKLSKIVSGKMIVNVDDSFGKVFEEAAIDPVTLGRNGKDIRIVGFENTEDGTNINFSIDNLPYIVETKLKNEFNVYNYLTAIGFAHALGYSINDIIDVTPLVGAPKGRCEQIKVNGGLAVVDYAHTPDAVEKIIESFKKTTTGKVITLVGCGGDRDKTKRPIMGDIASKKSDYVVFTSDNPRTEDPEQILRDILEGVKTDNYEVEVDRKKAIVKALDLIEPGDAVLILGKGHEDYQIVGKEKHHFDDAEEVKNYVFNKKANYDVNPV